MNLAYYVQPSNGLGHIFRAHKLLAHISQAAPDWRIFAFTDSPILLSLAANSKYTAILLPRPGLMPLRQPNDESLLQYLLDELKVEVFVASHWRCVANELRSLLPKLKQSGVKVVLALRDIIGQPEFDNEISQSFGARLDEVFTKYIDGIAVFGKEQLHAISDESSAFSCVDKLVYCGFIPPLQEAPIMESTESIIQCIVGGGFDSEGILETTIEAVPFLRQHHKLDQARFVTGPYCKSETVVRLHALSFQLPGITVTSFDPYWYDKLPPASIVICTGGYNILTEVLYRGFKTICIPKRIPGVDEEQEIRARCLSKVAQFVTLSSSDLTASEIVNKTNLIRQTPTFGPRRDLFDSGKKFREFLENI